MCRFLRRTQQPSRTMVFGWDTSQELDITTCTKNTVTPPSMAVLSKCTLKWPPATVSATTASRSSRPPPSPPSSARGSPQSSSITPKSSSRWCSRRLGHQLESSRPLTRLQGLICLCKWNMRNLMICFSLSYWKFWFLFWETGFVVYLILNVLMMC